jgi:hypothetical protein
MARGSSHTGRNVDPLVKDWKGTLTVRDLDAKEWNELQRRSCSFREVLERRTLELEQPALARPWDLDLYLADASVFATSGGGNPHWTVMAIADFGATRVAEN